MSAYTSVVRVKGDNELEMISRGFSTPDKELTLSEAFSLLLSFLVAVVIVVGVETKQRGCGLKLLCNHLHPKYGLCSN